MMDYSKTRTEAEAKKQTLLARLKEIPLEKGKLDDETERIKRELIGIDQILDGLAFMESDIPPDFEPDGFTDNIRKILSETPVPLVPTQIRDALQAKGIMGTSSKNLLINVHKVIERIEDELETTNTAEGKTAYRRTASWPARVALSSLYNEVASPLAGGRKLRLADLAGRTTEDAKEHPIRELSRKPSSIGARISRGSGLADTILREAAEEQRKKK